MSRRTALSRVEVFLLILIIGVGAGLILPLVAKIREAAALSTCSNNLKQIGVAVHNHGSANQGSLPALIDAGSSGLPSVFALLLPYLEASPGYYRKGMTPRDYHAHSSVTFSFQNKDGTPGTLHGGVANRTWRTFIDPSDASGLLVDVPLAMPDGTTGYYATGNYAANGLVSWGSGRLPESFPDGAGNGILFAERPQVCRTAQGDVVHNFWGLGIYSPHMPTFATLTPSTPAGLDSTGQVAPVTPLPEEGAGERIRVRIGTQEAASQLPDFQTPIQRVGKGQSCDARLPGSSHRAGMQVGMADGSVRLFGGGTDPWVFWSACTRGESMRQDDRR